MPDAGISKTAVSRIQDWAVYQLAGCTKSVPIVASLSCFWLAEVEPSCKEWLHKPRNKILASKKVMNVGKFI